MDATRTAIRKLLTEADGPVGVPVTMFHVTPATNVPSILQRGLIPNQQDDQRIYLFRTQDEAWDGLTNWLGLKYGEDEQYALLAVQVSPAMIQEDPDLPLSAVYTQTAIGPPSIQVLNPDF